MSNKSNEALDFSAALDAEENAIARSQGLIEWVMEQSGVSNKELATRLNISQSAVSQLLGLSPQNLSVKKLARVLHALGDKLVISSEMREQFLGFQAAKELSLAQAHAPITIGKKRTDVYENLHANDDFMNGKKAGLYKRQRTSAWVNLEAA